jgi:hypothetical protein
MAALESFVYACHHVLECFLKSLATSQDIEKIAIGSRIRDLERLRKNYGPGRWRKLKGFAAVRLEDGTVCDAELHWYEAHGIGKKEMRVKELLD